MLESLGLTATAEAVYRTMLRQRSWGVQEIADHLDISKSEVKNALDLLVKLTLISPSDTVDSALTPVNPSVGLTALLARAEAEVAERHQQIDATRAAIAAIASEAAAGIGRDSPVRRLETVDAVRTRLSELTAATSRECISLNPNSAQTPGAKQASAPLNKQMLERGVSLRCVYQDSFRNEPNLVAYARWLTSLGGQTRTVPTVPLLMIVYDRRIALVPIDPTDTRRGALEVHSSGVVALACALFEQIWAMASPFGDTSVQRDAFGLDAMQRELLTLLAAGHTDEQAARRIGVSLTTVRRHMSTLMDRLDARSRFQAGVHAAERGWLG